MVARLYPTPAPTEPKKKDRRGGRRAGAGRRVGSIDNAKRVARAMAARTGSGKYPDELLREWADTGYMDYVSTNGRRKRVELAPSDRISCARGSANFYRHPKAAVQSADAPPPVLRLELDDKTLAALVREAPDKVDMLRDVLRVIQSGGADLPQLAQQQGGADPARYGRMLSESSETAGRA